MTILAEEIKKATLETINHLLKSGKIFFEMAGDKLSSSTASEAKQTMKRLEKQKAALEACESEEDIFECFCDVLEAVDMPARCKALAEATTSEPKNDIQKALFGR